MIATPIFQLTIGASPIVGGTNGEVLVVSAGGLLWQVAQLPISAGGTGAATASAGFNALSPITTAGDLIYGSGTNTSSRLAGNASATKEFLSMTSSVPSWGVLVAADMPATVVLTTGSYANPAWLTSILGSIVSGNISGNAANVTGIVSTTNGGSGANLSGTGGSGQYVKQATVGGAFTVGTIPIGDLPASVVLTFGSYADPAWITSLSGAKVSGNISGNAAGLTATLGVGTGGTGANLGSTGGAGQYVKQTSSGAAFTVGMIAAADMPVFVASGSSHAAGAVPDPGSTSGTTRYLREDATFANPVTIGQTVGSGTSGYIHYTDSSGKLAQDSNFQWIPGTGIQLASTYALTSAGSLVLKAATGSQITLDGTFVAVKDPSGSGNNVTLYGGTGSAQCVFVSPTADAMLGGIIAQHSTTQSADLLQFTNHAGSGVLSRVNASGTIIGSVNGLGTVGASATIMVALGNLVTLTSTASTNMTLTPSGAGVAGQVMRIVITSDATGGDVVTFASTFKPNGTMTLTASKGHTITFVSDGTNWWETARTTGL